MLVHAGMKGGLLRDPTKMCFQRLLSPLGILGINMVKIPIPILLTTPIRILNHDRLSTNWKKQHWCMTSPQKKTKNWQQSKEEESKINLQRTNRA